ncbi:MAG: hypothetical protein ACUVRD_04260 [Bacteroidia bacterium]
MKEKRLIPDELFDVERVKTILRVLFDTLKEKYGRDIFGQGWLYGICKPW